MSQLAIMVRSFASLPGVTHSGFQATKLTLALLMDAKGNLIAGSDGSGLVYQIKPNGEGFVLYSAPEQIMAPAYQ